MNTFNKKILIVNMFMVSCAYAAQEAVLEELSLWAMGGEYCPKLRSPFIIGPLDAVQTVPILQAPDRPTEPYLTKKRLEALVALRFNNRWRDTSLIAREAAVLGVNEKNLEGAIIHIKKKDLPRKLIFTASEIEKYYKKHLENIHWRGNYNVIRVKSGLTRENCKEKAIEWNVPFEQLDAYYTHLLRGEELRRSDFSLEQADILAFEVPLDCS
jgi:hypothetical protein